MRDEGEAARMRRVAAAAVAATARDASAVPVPITLRRVDPVAAAGLLAHPADLRRLAVALRRQGIAGLALDAGGPVAADLDRWRAALAPHRLIAAALVAADCFDVATVAARVSRGPLLVVLRPAVRAPRATWLACRDTLALARLANLRVAVLAPACLARSLPGDLAVRMEATTQTVFSLGAGCRSCGERAACRGLAGQLDADDLEPLAPLVSNQIDCEPVAAPGAPGVCPTAAGLVVPEAEVARWLVVGTGRERRAWRIAAAGWSQAELQQAVEARGQVYLDVSDKARLDDFAADLEPLRRVHAPHEDAGSRCPGSWAARDVAPFAAEEADLQGRIAALRGTVIDVGAGPIRYLQLLAAHVRAGRVTYVAVDPDAVTLRRMRTHLPGAMLVAGTGEALPVADGAADAVLMLRSWNHLVDPQAALAQVARVLRPGGMLIVVDNVVFVLARSAQQLARAHAISATRTPFEHHRNDDATEAAAALGEAGFFAVQHVAPVGPSTSNQWLVVAQRLSQSAGAMPSPRDPGAQLKPATARDTVCSAVLSAAHADASGVRVGADESPALASPTGGSQTDPRSSGEGATRSL